MLLRNRNIARKPEHAVKGGDNDALREREVRVKEAELELRRAEFQQKLREFNESRWKNPLVVALVGAALAAVANLAVTYLTNKREVELAERKFVQSKAEEKERRLVQAVTALSSALSRGFQRQAWIVWTLTTTPQSLDSKAVADYDAAMKDILPNAFAAHISLANEDRALFFRLAPIIGELSRLDSELAALLGEWQQLRQIDRKRLTEVAAKVRQASTLLGRRVSAAYLNVEVDSGAPELEASSTVAPTRGYSCLPGALGCSAEMIPRSFAASAPAVDIQLRQHPPRSAPPRGP